MADKRLVLAIFPDEGIADNAAEYLKQWDKATEDVKLDAVGVLVLDDEGKVKAHKMGSRSTAKGAGIGLVLAVVAPPTLLAGVVGGGVLGAFHHKGLGLSDADRTRIGEELTDGKAAVGALASEEQADAVAAELKKLGGETEAHPVSDEALEAVAAAPVGAGAGSGGTTGGTTQS
jgi:uncharacterized membrane protein